MKKIVNSDPAVYRRPTSLLEVSSLKMTPALSARNVEFMYIDMDIAKKNKNPSIYSIVKALCPSFSICRMLHLL